MPNIALLNNIEHKDLRIIAGHRPGLGSEVAWVPTFADEFLSSTFDGSGPNPNYVEAYGQLDLSVGYNVNKNLSVSFEGINLTDEIQRTHGRTKQQVLFVTQSGPRYMLAARYKF